jgi:hypothetical protein
MHEVPTPRAPGALAFQPPSPALASGPHPSPRQKKAAFGRPRSMLFKHRERYAVLRDNQSAWARRPSSERSSRLRKKLHSASIFDAPWSLSRKKPPSKYGDRQPGDPAGGAINREFEGMNAEQFIKWLRDALAYGVRQPYLPSPRRMKTFTEAERLTASISRPEHPNDRTKCCDAGVFQPWANKGQSANRRTRWPRSTCTQCGRHTANL